jgi:hypothetical protein
VIAEMVVAVFDHEGLARVIRYDCRKVGGCVMRGGLISSVSDHKV